MAAARSVSSIPDILRAVLGVLLGAFALMALQGCADEGAGGFTTVSGNWTGAWLEGGTPSGGANQPMAHAVTGGMSLTLSEGASGAVTGTGTMSPDICAEGPAETSANTPVTITGMRQGNALTLQYTSSLVSPPQDVVLTFNYIFVSMVGDYDGSACDPAWTGGVRLTKQP